jgi:hypothetical protein
MSLPPKKWDIQKLHEGKEIKQKYQRRIEEVIGENREGGGKNVKEIGKRMQKVIKEVADEIISKERNQLNREWFDEECVEIICLKNSQKSNATKRKNKS